MRHPGIEPGSQAYSEDFHEQEVHVVGSSYSTTKPMTHFHNFYIPLLFNVFMINRGVRWNVKTDTGEQERSRHRYTFAIINAPREINAIKEKIFRQLETIAEFRDIIDYPIPGSNGLHCEVFSLSSDVGTIRRPAEIYGNINQFRRDRNLFERDECEMIPYVERLLGMS